MGKKEAAVAPAPTPPAADPVDVDAKDQDPRCWRWFVGSMIGMGDFAMQCFEDPIKASGNHVLARRLTKIAVVPGRGMGLIHWIGYTERLIGPDESTEDWKKSIECVINRDALTFTYEAVAEKLVDELEKLWGVRRIELARKSAIALP